MTMLEGNMDWLINTPLLTIERAGFFYFGGGSHEGFHADLYKTPQ